ncbi:MAG: rod-binding protein [Alphaproteobacteria bacterium]|nr:rod-binding protein [Alphaproteobacteria bacterium]
MDSSVAVSGNFIPLNRTGSAVSGADYALSSGQNKGNIDKAAEDFQAMFMSQMLKPMFDSVEVDDSFGGGHGEEVMRGLLVQEYGKSLAAGSNSYLSDAIKSEMLKAQEKSQSSNGLTKEVM